ncbi:HsdM family class I SAM-dependent methyltransferase [Mesomycoplasma dispar]|uniref:site-specific DNA-methyltransferase (adenine-specific) n=1 Tax=Mesomycoplasma dispar TaxID=86660 RepID=A0ABM6PQX4_9BACT|nr:N-6 DNA methylase [Mesomycoplasma dispar]ATP59517.1 SAM-dependent methyltransferase [Mesomycoplasma dispar]
MAAKVKKYNEFEVVKIFSTKLGLKNQTDGTINFYKKTSKDKQSTKPDGIYYYDGIVFILDAKAQGKKFSGQIKHYMELESNKHFVGFEYNYDSVRVYINGKLELSENSVENKDYYKNKYFPVRENNGEIVTDLTKKLVQLFRNANIDKQLNVHFIGTVFIVLTFYKDLKNHDINIENVIYSTNSTTEILVFLINALKNIITDEENLNKIKTRDFLIRSLNESTLKNADFEDIFQIIITIFKIYNFIEISQNDFKGFDIMNRFLQVFRKWNSVNANEKGEVFTPDHIAKLMFKLISIDENDRVLDPTCGSGTFLTNSLPLMMQKVQKKYGNDQLKIEEIILRIKKTQLIGVEVNEFNASLASINMMLHKDGSSQIIYGDCFKTLKKIPGFYNKVLMNPPFNQKTTELMFVFEALKYLKTDGDLATILPKTVLKGNVRDRKNQELLKQIFSFCDLVSVISLPDELFAPNAGVATAIAIFHKCRDFIEGFQIFKEENLIHNHTQKETLFISMSDDGFYKPKDNFRYPTEKWEVIEKEILECFFEKKYNELRAISKKVNFSNQLLFENFNSHRPYEVPIDRFIKTIRENLAAKILSGIKPDLEINQKFPIDESKIEFKKVKIVDLIKKIDIGAQKSSIDRKIENKFIKGIPLIIAKKDNNGVGGLIENPTKTWKDKIVIISGGDGGGGKTYYCDFEFAATNFALICDLKGEWKPFFDKYAIFYLATKISERLYKYVNHGLNRKELNNEIQITLPFNSKNRIDTEFMSKFIKNLKIY